MLALPATLIIWFALPLRYEKGNYVEKVKKIDFGGILLSIASILLILVSHLYQVTCKLLMIIGASFRSWYQLCLELGHFHCHVYAGHRCLGCLRVI